METLTIGDPESFAIESGITRAYVRPYFHALGFFLIHVGGQCYGVRLPEATMLDCSFGEVRDRIERRGKHTASFAADADAGEIADAFLSAGYDPDYADSPLLGLSGPDFSSLKRSNHLVWAPDGDEAFDDSSRVLQFDVGNRVRLIGYKPQGEGYRHGPHTLSDQWISSERFYSLLSNWRDAIYAQWAAMPKSPDRYWMQ